MGGAALWMAWPTAARAQAEAPASAASRPAPAVRVPRVRGRLKASQLGLLLNEDDPYSVAVGEAYARRRGIPSAQVVAVRLPVRPTLEVAEFEALQARIEQAFGAAGEDVQALAMAWVQPYAVGCQSLTAAVTLGLDAQLCRNTCGRPRVSPYFNHPTHRPWSDLRLRPSMLIAAPTEQGAQALIERGAASDGQLGRRGPPWVHAWFVSTSDRARSVRAPLYPPPVRLSAVGVEVHVAQAEEAPDAERVVLYQTGAARLEGLDRLQFVPGALADHLTSFGGRLEGASGQSSALAWIDAGATASYGTVSEPCNHPQKFPHPQILLLHYLQGATALEAYWKSVAWPQQGVFVGDPLAAPFARD